MLLKIYLKEMKDSFRDRRTLLLTVLLPIVMMSGLVLFYENMLSDGEGKTFTLAVNDGFGGQEEALFIGMDNIEFIKSANPEAVLEEGDAQAALVLEERFFEKVENGEAANVTVLGNSFSQNSSILMAQVTAALSNFEKLVVADRLEAEGTPQELVQPFTIEQIEITEETAGINMIAMLIPLILALAIGVGASPAASDLFAGEKEKKTMEALLMTPINRLTLLIAKWMTISTVGSITGIITLIVVAIEINFLTKYMKAAVSFGDNTFLIVGFAILVSIVYAMFMGTLQMVTSIMGKTVKEAQSYSSPIMMIAIFPIMIISSIGINELEFHHYAIPLMNIFTILKELSFGIINYQHLGIMIGSNLLCVGIAVIAGRIMFMKDKWVMN
ncbi:ABC transporter permease [Sutcliffiella rhizosphaerae]|uniref:ABC transporter permease protein NatB n=1 Tax=Sutcliffiella rhizosphaerae TaxID=2880967 RepID=A0ABM8YJX3_9BACI|nr:ABC transporter permease subunit [Sutcliffiella rhizosphaerae]CAG9620222.1 ABC transporter permease protein NatB [Sutcliffiella rhizosphaerae]